MTRGLYAAASGMIAQLARQDIHAQNMANASSVGYRRSRSAMASFSEVLAASHNHPERVSGGAVLQAVGVDRTQGALSSTGNSFDLALSGEGFFTVNTPSGLQFTRDGSFQRDARGMLVTRQGYPVMGVSGPIMLPAADMAVTEQGEISSGGRFIDRLRISNPRELQPAGSNLYRAAGFAPAGAYRVAQGMLEQSNVSIITEMGQMLSGLRLYEANAGALRHQDESLGILLQRVQ